MKEDPDGISLRVAGTMSLVDRKHVLVTESNSMQQREVRMDHSAFETDRQRLEGLLQIDRKTIYGYVQCRRIPYVRVESNVFFLRGGHAFPKMRAPRLLPRVASGPSAQDPQSNQSPPPNRWASQLFLSAAPPLTGPCSPRSVQALHYRWAF